MQQLLSKIVERHIMRPMVSRMDRLEESIRAMPGAHTCAPNSPERFHIMKNALKIGAAEPSRLKSRHMLCSLLGVFKSMRDVSKNPPNPATVMDVDARAAMEAYLHSLGISSIGYTRVPSRWVFRDMAVLFPNAIVTTMEMDKARIATAPGPLAGKAVHEIYCHQGRAMIKGAQYLRERGFAAHAGHPLMGNALYPALAQLAGLGQLGTSGLLITPEHGPRVRIAAIFTSIENLPFNEGNPHAWVAEYCQRCHACVRKCPQQAIHGEPRTVSQTGTISCIDSSRCFPYFLKTSGCSVCINACAFNTGSYTKIRKAFLR